MRMIANSPAAVAAAFSNSCRPTSLGERCWAETPDPITTAARKAPPRNSASRQRGSGDGGAPTPLCGDEELVCELAGEPRAANLRGDRCGVVGDPLDLHL